ncbi:MAG TPA: DUF1656 domain-containing protein [Enterovirga sp.]|jgi:hypothetical protein|nr:DUF1656 domain-containing protein [Enterovirga sp.]
MNPELDLAGIYVPHLLVAAVLAFLVSVPLRRALAWTGFYRLVWHRALFDLALFVVLLGAVTALTSQLVS